MSRRWTHAETAMLRYYRTRGMRATDISKRLLIELGTHRTPAGVWSKASDLNLPDPDRIRRNEPSREEWVAAATRAAREAHLRPGDVMAGCRLRAAVRARQKAWRRILEAHPHVTVAGLARVSGFHWTSILHGLGRLSRRRDSSQQIMAAHVRRMPLTVSTP